jgi:hypothetical protein
MAERRTVVRMALGYAMRRVDGSDDGTAGLVIVDG